MLYFSTSWKYTVVNIVPSGPGFFEIISRELVICYTVFFTWRLTYMCLVEFLCCISSLQANSESLGQVSVVVSVVCQHTAKLGIPEGLRESSRSGSPEGLLAQTAKGISRFFQHTYRNTQRNINVTRYKPHTYTTRLSRKDNTKIKQKFSLLTPVKYKYDRSWANSSCKKPTISMHSACTQHAQFLTSEAGLRTNLNLY